MTNHVHLLATPERADSISKVFQSVGRRYFNYTYKRSGTPWEGRYRATVVDSETYLLTLTRYTEMNPVRARTVAHLSEYRWSSYTLNALGATGPNADWVKPHNEFVARNSGTNRVALEYG
jgi:putative transposase